MIGVIGVLFKSKRAKLFYASCNPPIEFDKLRNIGIPSEYNYIVDELLDMKINNSEKKIIPRNKELDAYIENELNKLDKIVHEFVKEEDKNWNLLNEYFKKILG